MADPRYRPRDYCDRPEAFGRASEVHFAPLPLEGTAKRTVAESRRQLDNEANAGSAQRQHEHALAIRHILNVTGMSTGAYANRVGESAKRIRAVLGGTAVMRQDDIERAEQVLGTVKLVVLVNARRKKLREIQAAIDEISRGSEPPDPLDPMSQPLPVAARTEPDSSEVPQD